MRSHRADYPGRTKPQTAPRPEKNISLADEQLAQRLGRAWRESRRGSSTAALREYLLGDTDEAIEFGQMDTLDLLALSPAPDR